MNLKASLDFLEDIRNHKECGCAFSSCRLYELFDHQCQGKCPFIVPKGYKDAGCCGLGAVMSTIREITERDCAPSFNEPQGCQKDFNKSLLRRVQKLESELQEKCISDRNGYNCLYEKCMSNARAVDSLNTSVLKAREPFIDGNFTQLQRFVKEQGEEIQRIRDHLYAIGRKGQG